MVLHARIRCRRRLFSSAQLASERREPRVSMGRLHRESAASSSRAGETLAEPSAGKSMSAAEVYVCAHDARCAYLKQRFIEVALGQLAGGE